MSLQPDMQHSGYTSFISKHINNASHNIVWLFHVVKMVCGKKKIIKCKSNTNNSMTLSYCIYTGIKLSTSYQPWVFPLTLWYILVHCQNDVKLVKTYQMKMVYFKRAYFCEGAKCWCNILHCPTAFTTLSPDNPSLFPLNASENHSGARIQSQLPPQSSMKNFSCPWFMKLYLVVDSIKIR